MRERPCRREVLSQGVVGGRLVCRCAGAVPRTAGGQVRRQERGQSSGAGFEPSAIFHPHLSCYGKPPHQFIPVVSLLSQEWDFGVNLGNMCKNCR